MKRGGRPQTQSRRPAIACASAAVALLLAASPARATPTPSEAGEVRAEWVGRYCTPQGCRGPLGSAAGNAAGFGAAALAVCLLARRRRA